MLMDDPRTNALLAMESVARVREDLPAFLPMLHRLEEWATSKGVDVAAVYATTPQYESRILFRIEPGDIRANDL
jgi:hypothetical protein